MDPPVHTIVIVPVRRSKPVEKEGESKSVETALPHVMSLTVVTVHVSATHHVIMQTSAQNVALVVGHRRRRAAETERERERRKSVGSC